MKIKNMNIPFFSILIPVYNVERYLEDCLESVLAQSFSDYEVILIDDGSKDRSGQICDAYADRYPDRIRVHHKQNQGLISARSAGLQQAKGKYVCFLDSDDCWGKHTLKRLHEITEETNSDVVLFCWNRIDENGKPLNEKVQSIFPQSGPIDKKTVFEKMLVSTALNSLCIKCCKLELFDVDADYSQFYTLQNGEDLLQSLPVLYQANTFFYLDEVLYQYRANTASITHSYRKGQHQTLNVIRPMLYDYCVKLGLDTPENNTAFFRRYLLTLWVHLRALYGGISSETERYAVLDEMHSYEFVNRAQDYLDKTRLPLFERWGLSLFYEWDNHKLDRYMRIFLGMQKVGHRLNQFKTGNDNEMR